MFFPFSSQGQTLKPRRWDVDRRFFSGEFFTSTDYSPVRSLAMNADLGIVQVVLQGRSLFLAPKTPDLVL